MGDDRHLFNYFKLKDLPNVYSETQTDEAELGPADFAVDIEAEPEPVEITEAKRKIKFNLGLPDLPSFNLNWRKKGKDLDTSRDSEEADSDSKTGSLKFGFRGKAKKPQIEYDEEIAGG